MTTLNVQWVGKCHMYICKTYRKCFFEILPYMYMLCQYFVEKMYEIEQKSHHRLLHKYTHVHVSIEFEMFMMRVFFFYT